MFWFGNGAVFFVTAIIPNKQKGPLTSPSTDGERGPGMRSAGGWSAPGLGELARSASPSGSTSSIPMPTSEFNARQMIVQAIKLAISHSLYTHNQNPIYGTCETAV